MGVGAYGLADWSELANGSLWPVSLLGNGASRAVSEVFAYDSLLAEANLADADLDLFETIGTSNFEEVLRALDIARFVCQQLNHNDAGVQARRDGIRQALATTIHNHHVGWQQAAGWRLTEIRAALRDFSAVFTTSYDLILYWAMNYPAPDGFIDHFWHMPDNHFDAADSPTWNDRTVVYWLHGGLHIYRWGSDGTAKRVNDGAALLGQFAEGGFLPLYVAEGTAEQKRRAIRDSDYLSFCLRSLESDDRAIAIVGHAIGEPDQHLVEAISCHPDRRVAYGVYPTTQLEVDATRARIQQRLNNDAVEFFDSTTHPLGAPTLTVDP
jgi:hypothetical protein